MSKDIILDFDNLTPEQLVWVKAAIQEGLDDIAAGRVVEITSTEQHRAVYDSIRARGRALARDRDR